MSLNKKLVTLLFPPEDLPHLQYRQEDGYEVEPEFFVPVIPTLLVDDYELPATGWKVCMYARDISQVIIAVANLISDQSSDGNLFLDKDSSSDGTDLVPAFDPNHFVYGNTEYSLGSYTFHGVKKGYLVIEVTELPLGIWTDNFLNNLKGKEYVYDYDDKSGSD